MSKTMEVNLSSGQIVQFIDVDDCEIDKLEKRFEIYFKDEFDSLHKVYDNDGYSYIKISQITSINVYKTVVDNLVGFNKTR